MRSAAPPAAGTALILSSRPPRPQPRIVFHDPIAEETDVRLSTSVRLQFSSHMIAETFSEHVRVSYATADSVSASPIPKFVATYHDVTRSLEVSFASPLGRFQTVRVELLEGIASADGQLLSPWTLTFTTGSN